KRFENAEAAPRLALERENGVHLAIEDEHIYTGALLTLSLDTGRPATSVAKLANALNLQPTKRGEYYALVRGIGSESALETLGGEDFARGYFQENPWRTWIDRKQADQDGRRSRMFFSDDEDFEFDFDAVGEVDNGEETIDLIDLLI
ncbi:MAG: hypothetical protein IIB13_02200, partial [Chloroflexi bacterium]|nr:hypothetical protein [Chloroflexota bacterium]